MKKPVIDSIKIELLPDDNPDLSYLGEYVSIGKSRREWDICRQYDEYYANLTLEQIENIKMSRNECEFFRPYAYGEKPGTELYKQYGKQNYENMEKINNDLIQIVGIRASSIVSYCIGTDNYRLETLTSAGLWGIEYTGKKDSYIMETVNYELSELKEHLKVLNVSIRNWKKKTSEALANFN